MRLDPEILDGPPELGARILALAWLADADDALARLSDPKDREGGRALPEALARLSTSLRALAPALGGAVPAALAGELEALGRAAAPLREPATFAAWLGGARGDLAAPYRGAADWLADRIERRCRRAREELAADAAPRLRRALSRLHRALVGGRASGARAGVPATFAAFLAGALRARTRAVREAIAAVAGVSDAAGLEAACAEARRLHELVAPLEAAEVGAALAVEALAPLRAALEAGIAARAAALAIEGGLLEARAEEVRRGEAIPGLRPGLLALLRLAEQRDEVAQRELAGHLAARATPVTDRAYAVVASLEAPAEAEGAAAPERRFLVTALPPEAVRGASETLEEGWLPGDRRESVGLARSPEGERCFRAVAAARGRPPRIETIPRAEYDAFWPLTEGRRISKRRHPVASAPGWRLDEYLDRPLVLAVCASGDAEPAPAWLEPVLVRDVSGERGYLDETLARRTARRSA